MGTHSICLYKEVAKQYTSWNPKSTELLDCSLIGVCAVIRSNTVQRNDEADYEAKSALNQPVTNIKIPYTDYKHRIRKYRIRPNYRTVRLGFSKYDYFLRIPLKTNYQQRPYLVFMRVFFFLIFFIKTCGYSFMGTHNICLYKVDKKYTGYNLKTMELLDCALIGVCAVIRSNTVFTKSMPNNMGQHSI